MGIISSKSFIICAICSFVQNWKKILKNLYCTCEPFSYLKDDNHVDKEYEEANERCLGVERWGCIGDVGQGGHFHMIDWEGLVTLHVAY